MAITQAYSGTETVTTTEWSLTTDTSYDTGDLKADTGVFQIVVDLNALAAGDVFELKVYEKCLSGSTARLVLSVQFANVQSAPLWFSPALILMHGWDATLKKIAGTDRAIDWSIRKSA